VEVSGAGELIALGTGNPLSEEMYVGTNSRRAFQGHLLAVVRSNGLPGAITLAARAAGLPEAKVELRAE
jgi:beta-galactosidase